MLKIHENATVIERVEAYLKAFRLTSSYSISLIIEDSKEEHAEIARFCGIRTVGEFRKALKKLYKDS